MPLNFGKNRKEEKFVRSESVSVLKSRSNANEAEQQQMAAPVKTRSRSFEGFLEGKQTPYSYLTHL